MGIGLSHIKHVKLPVTDLRRSASWYRALFDLELIAESVEQGEVRGVSLFDRDGGFELALRRVLRRLAQPRDLTCCAELADRGARVCHRRTM